MGRVVGIDLGTTNSVVAYLNGDRVETIPNSEGAKTTPSMVYFGQEIIVGELAKRQAVTGAGLVVRSAKRLIGRRYSELVEMLDDYPYEIVGSEEDHALIKLIDGRIVPPELVSSQVLEKMKQTAEDYLGDEIESAVITVPAYFNDSQRSATKIAAEMAGLGVLRIINEPTAAALAYGINQQNRQQRIAVFDFGGGTFDISILQIQGDIFEVLSTNGNTQLGGDNLDLRLFQEICDAILQETGIDPTQDLQAVSRIREAAEKIKIELSSLSTTHLSLPFIVADSKGPKHFERDYTREEFNRWMQPLFDMLMPPCKAALADSHADVSSIDEVILVGGSTRIPRVQEMVEKFFGKQPNRTVNPDEAVAVGAAIQAGVMRGELEEILLLDVTPLSLGIELAGGVFKPLIARNASIPCEATRKFTTVIDNQESVLIHVLQGERAKAVENRSIAKFRLTSIPPMPKELPEIEVTFRLDANGILEVGAMELTSGISTGIQVEGVAHSASMGKEEMEKFLENLTKHQKEDEEFLRTANKRANAERTQARIQRILDEIGDVITEIDLKRIKETMLRHDLAVSAREWNIADQHDAVLVEMIEKYEGQAEMHRALNRELQIPEKPRQSKTVPTSGIDALEAPAEIPGAAGSGGPGGGGSGGGAGDPGLPAAEPAPVAVAAPAPAPAPAPVPQAAPPPPPPAKPAEAEDDGHGPKRPVRRGPANLSLTANTGVLHATDDDFDLSLAPPPPPPPK